MAQIEGENRVVELNETVITRRGRVISPTTFDVDIGRQEITPLFGGIERGHGYRFFLVWVENR